jgi:hypothetical protein
MRLVVVTHCRLQHPRSTLRAVARKAGGGCSVILVVGGTLSVAAVRCPCLLGPPSSLSGAGAGAGAVRCRCGGVGASSCGPDPGPCVVRRRLSVSVWCHSSSLASTRNPPREQLLAGLVEGAGSSVGGVGHWLWCCRHSPRPWSPIVRRSSFPIPRPPSLSSIVPHPRCPFPIGRRPAIHPASRGSQWWHRVGCVVSGAVVTTCSESKNKWEQLVSGKKHERNIQKNLPTTPTTIDVVGARFVCDVARLQSGVWFSGVVVGVGVALTERWSW